MPLNIVLIEPEIPNNTGNIGRLSLAAGANLHLVKPFGFELSDARVKRAGLDYWKHVNLFIYENADEFFEKNQNAKMAFFSSHAEKSFWEMELDSNIFLVFGKESKGLDKSILDKYKKQQYSIPIHSEHVRSLNVANAVAIVVYEALRKLNVQN